MNPPPRLVVVVGTATEIGKTWVACRLLEQLRSQGLHVAACKPAQSFDAGDPAAGRPTDADRLARASGQRPTDVCPAHRWYPVAMAPPMAAEQLGRPPIRLDDLRDEVTWPSGVDVGLVETAGGVRSPIADDADTALLTRLLTPDLVVLVADAGLGTINAVRGGNDALAPLPVVVLLNRYDPADPLHVGNRTWLVERDGLDVMTDPAALAARLVDHRQP